MKRIASASDINQIKEQQAEDESKVTKRICDRRASDMDTGVLDRPPRLTRPRGYRFRNAIRFHPVKKDKALCRPRTHTHMHVEMSPQNISITRAKAIECNRNSSSGIPLPNACIDSDFVKRSIFEQELAGPSMVQSVSEDFSNNLLFCNNSFAKMRITEVEEDEDEGNEDEDDEDEDDEDEDYEDEDGSYC